MKRIHAILLGTLAVAATSCGGSDSPSGTNNNGNTETIVNASAANVFAPNSVTIQVGHSVTWEFGPVDHNVIFGGTAGAPASIETSHSTSVTRTFNTAGTFAYICSLHASMGGVVIVGAGSNNSYSGY